MDDDDDSDEDEDDSDDEGVPSPPTTVHVYEDNGADTPEAVPLLLAANTSIGAMPSGTSTHRRLTINS
jgi:hypothetical protein